MILLNVIIILIMKLLIRVLCRKKLVINNIIKYIGKLIKFNKRLSIMLNKLLKGGKSLNFDKCFYVLCLFYYVVIYF